MLHESPKQVLAGLYDFFAANPLLCPAPCGECHAIKHFKWDGQFWRCVGCKHRAGGDGMELALDFIEGCIARGEQIRPAIQNPVENATKTRSNYDTRRGWLDYSQGRE